MSLSLILCAAIVLQTTAAVLPHVHGDCHVLGGDTGSCVGAPQSKMENQRESRFEESRHSTCLACTVHGPVVMTVPGSPAPCTVTMARFGGVVDKLEAHSVQYRQIHLRGPPITA